MSLLILSRYPLEHEPKRLFEEGKKADLRVKIVNYDQLSLSWSKHEVKVALPESECLKDYSFLIPRSSAHLKKKSLVGMKTAVIRSLPEKVVCLNIETFSRWPVLGKVEQGVMLAQAGVPVIPSWFFAKRSKQEVFLKKAPWPLILKGRFGSHSRKTFKVGTMQEAEKRLAVVSDEFFYQPLIKSQYYWRVLVLGDRILGIMKRKTSDRFLKKGFVKNITEKELGMVALGATRAVEAEFAGVDLLINEEGQPLVIEVNRTPQFKIFEKRLSVNVAKALIKYLLTKKNLSG